MHISHYVRKTSLPCKSHSPLKIQKRSQSTWDFPAPTWARKSLSHLTTSYQGRSEHYRSENSINTAILKLHHNSVRFFSMVSTGTTFVTEHQGRREGWERRWRIQFFKFTPSIRKSNGLTPHLSSSRRTTRIYQASRYYRPFQLEKEDERFDSKFLTDESRILIGSWRAERLGFNSSIDCRLPCVSFSSPVYTPRCPKLSFWLVVLGLVFVLSPSPDPSPLFPLWTGPW